MDCKIVGVAKGITMGLKKFVEELTKEKKVIEGDATKDKVYKAENKFSDAEEAKKEFKKSVAKLFNVNRWSDLPGLTSDFTLHTSSGVEKKDGHPQVHDYIKIVLPAPAPENWVIVTDIIEEDNLAEFTVSPSKDPTAIGKEKKEIKHFFIDEATSTFKVELKGKSITAFEIGKNEGINNEGKEAGDRELINTIIAEGGWAGFQKLQWQKLTDYLVHKIEIKD